jgi:CRISPR/Cas system-associated protein Cas10 (large subunit of type III CRISPR-Cas system)
MNIYQKLVIAAYLHDIWKLAIRGWNYRNQKNFEVAHAQFVNDFLDKLNNKDWADIWTIAAHHHWKDVNAVLNWDFDEDIKFATWCVYMADNLSAKERLEANEKEDFSHISFPLWNIFDVLRFWDVVETNKKQWWEPVKLSDFEATSIDYNQTEKYKNLFNDFEKDLENLIKSNLQIENFNKFISQLDTLFKTT